MSTGELKKTLKKLRVAGICLRLRPIQAQVEGLLEQADLPGLQRTQVHLIHEMLLKLLEDYKESLGGAPSFKAGKRKADPAYHVPAEKYA